MAKQTKVEKTIETLQGLALLEKNDSFGYLAKIDYLPLLADKLIEVNVELLDEEGNAAVRLTDLGRAKVAAVPAKVAAVPAKVAEVTPLANKVAFALIEVAELPSTKRAGRGDTYPWVELSTAALNVGFFVPLAEGEELLAKLRSVSSSTNGATSRFKKEGRPDVKFKAFAVEDGVNYGYSGVSGVAVHRVAA